jgi:hypothetical protein
VVGGVSTIHVVRMRRFEYAALTAALRHMYFAKQSNIQYHLCTPLLFRPTSPSRPYTAFLPQYHLQVPTSPSRPDVDERRPALYRRPTLPQIPHCMIQRVRDGVSSDRVALEQLLIERLRNNGTVVVPHRPIDRHGE